MNRKIDGTFFEFRHHNTPEGKYWNPALEKFTGENWRQKIREIAEIQMEYIVVMATALYDKCYVKSSDFPFAETLWEDPIEEILDEADKCGVKVFLGNGFYGDYSLNVVQTGIYGISLVAAKLDAQIREEGLDKVLEEAGFAIRQPGCSACLAMNDDKIPAGKYSVSTSNRNFEGRQGPGSRTLLASPLTAAAAAITGVITDPREFM